MANEFLNGYVRPHNRVLKPPGGESHDIFGTGGSSADTPRRSKNYLQSNIFGSDVTDAPPSAPKPSPKQAQTSDDMNAVFGTPSTQLEQQPRKVKDYFKSNIFGNDDDDQVNGNATPRRSSSSSLGGNPITGEGYVNGATNGEAKENGHCNGGKARQPPGGQSTRLW